MSARRGVLVVVLVLAVMGGIVLAAALSLRSPATRLLSNAVLTLEVPTDLPEIEPPYRPLDPFRTRRRQRLTVYDLTSGIRRAAEDDHVRGLVLRLGDLDWGWARIAEVRDAVASFRAAGKPVYASLADGSAEAEYLLASAADVVSLPPTAALDLDGLTLSALFLRGTFDKVGITPNFAHVGRYKSGVEGYTRTGMSPDTRAALESLLDDDWRLLCDSLAAARGMTPDSVAGLLDRGPYTAREALALGLVDTLAYESDVDSLAMRRGRRRYEGLRFERWLERRPEPAGGPRVALVVAAGSIVPGKSRESGMGGLELGAETLIEALRQARRKGAVKAIVLRIDSPGGVSSAADDIWREVERCRRAKPVIVSMSDYAASGGYYIAAPADSIVAQPGTVTGSIGVYGGKFNLLGLYRKLGLNVETVTRGRRAGMFSSFRDFTPEEAARFQDLLAAFYREFVSRVAQGRGMSDAAVDSVAQGRVWSGAAARAHGLVDRLGGLETALEMARARAGLPGDEPLVVERFPRVTRTFLQRMVEDLFGDEEWSTAGGAAALPPVVRAWISAARFRAGEILALLPWSLEIR